MPRHLLPLLLTLALVAAACTSSGDPADDGDALADAPVGSDRPESPGAAAVASDEDVVQVAESWLLDVYGMAPGRVDDLVVQEVTAGPGVQHVTFDQAIDGITVRGAQITVHVLDDGRVQTATDDLVEGEAGDPVPAIGADAATSIAAKAVTGMVDGDAQVDLVWLPEGVGLVLAYEVEVATTAPTGSWVVLLDAADGAVMSAAPTDFGRGRHTGDGRRLRAGANGPRQVAQAGAAACDVPSPGACVFVPDPIYASGGDLTDPSDTDGVLTGVELLGLDADDALVGEYVDTEPAGVAVEPTREEDGTWATGRAGRGFEAAMAYYWIDRTQRTIQRLGFTGLLDRPFPVHPVDPEVVDNAFYSPADRQISLGVGSDGVNEGEDASGIIHEYGHAILDAQAPALIGSDAAAPYHESFGDLLAFLTTLPDRTGDAGCLFAWTEGLECARRIDSDKVYPEDLEQEFHADGEIYNGAIHDVTDALLGESGLDIDGCPGTDDCDEVLDRVLTTLLASNSYLGNDPTLPDVAEAFVLANEAVFGGDDAPLIEAALAAHGLSGGGVGMVDSEGEPMAAGDGVQVALDITHTFRGDLEVLVGVVDSSFADLCEPIEVLGADDADGDDDVVGEIDLSDTDCAAEAPPSEDRIWYLQVTDSVAEDEGQINTFSVTVDGVTYRARGLPSPIGDADPDGTFALVDGSGTLVPTEGSQQAGDAPSGAGPVLDVDIRHPYLGDLDVSAGVVDADGEVLCSVPVLQPDPADSSDAGLAGAIDLGECAPLYPPTPDRRWYLLAVDTAELDEGTVDAVVLTGPDGVEYAVDGLPVEIPDADVDGVALLLDGRTGQPGQAGGGGAPADLPTARLSVTHPWRGDLTATVGVLSADSEVICQVVLATPDPTDSADGLDVDAPLTGCGRFYPPTAEQPWFLYVADTLAEDTGTLEAFEITGPAGEVHRPGGTPAPVPDGDPGGVVLLVTG